MNETDSFPTATLITITAYGGLVFITCMLLWHAVAALKHSTWKLERSRIGVRALLFALTAALLFGWLAMIDGDAEVNKKMRERLWALEHPAKTSDQDVVRH